MEYIPRMADDMLKKKLSAKGAVLVEGAKWCGKTTTASQQAGSILYMQDPDCLTQNLDTSRMETPSFCMIVTAVGNYAYKREDGICVVPVTCLKV